MFYSYVSEGQKTRQTGDKHDNQFVTTKVCNWCPERTHPRHESYEI